MALLAQLDSQNQLDHFLLVISTIFIILTLLAYCYREFLQPSVRRLRLKSPVKAYFLITSNDRFKLGYAVQDDQEHATKVLVLPAHTHELLLHLIWTTKLDFTQYELEFSFEGNDGLRKPLINYWFHPFIKIGPSIRRPGEYPGHYIDYHDNYHIVGVRNFAKGQTITSAFKITTRDPGIYYLKVGIVADGVDGIADGTPGAIGLRVRVQEHPNSNMRCVTHSHLIRPQDVLKY
jgi:hypothetical protein